MNPLNGLDLFDLGRSLAVFAITLTVIHYTINLTDFKVPRAQSRKKLLWFGLAIIMVGIVIVFLGGDSTIQNEIKALKGIGTDIFAIGCSSIIHSIFYAKKHQNYLKYVVWILIVVALIISILAVFANVYKW